VRGGSPACSVPSPVCAPPCLHSAHSNFGNTYSMIIAWLPTYYSEYLGLDMKRSAWFSVSVCGPRNGAPHLFATHPRLQTSKLRSWIPSCLHHTIGFLMSCKHVNSRRHMLCLCVLLCALRCVLMGAQAYASPHVCCMFYISCVHACMLTAMQAFCFGVCCAYVCKYQVIGVPRS